MKINLPRMVSNLKKVNPLTVLQEAVTNSIQAEATDIKIRIEYYNELSLQQEKTCLEKLSVIDNGKGFTDKNIESFCEYGTKEKIDLGCKGIGRISFLKIFSDIKIESLVKEEKKLVKINFSEKFEEEKHITKVEKNNIKNNKTTIEFNGIDPKINSFYSIQAVRDKLYSHLLPLLYLKRDSNIVITLENKDSNDEANIKTSDLPTFEEHSFNIKDTREQDVEFILNYSIEELSLKDLNKMRGFYCANSRTVCRFKDKNKNFSINPIDECQIIFLLSSDFLDDKVDNERNDFSMNPNQAKDTLFGDFSWEMINQGLDQEIATILKEKFPELEDEYKEIIKRIKRKHLHLVDYLGDINYLGGLIKQENIIKQAEEKFLKEKQSFRKEVEGKKYRSNELLKKASTLAGQELTEYILMRDKIISELETLSQKHNGKEKVLHNLLMERGSDTEKGSKKYLGPAENNIWLIDDKFMSYSYAASEKSIKESLKKIFPQSNNQDRGRPDISIFFQKEEGNYNAVIIELKALNIDGKKKFAGLEEIREYANSFKGAEKLNNVWYYLITNIGDDFEQKLKNDDFKLLFSTREKIYFKYYEKLSLYLYVISAEEVISNARARNKTFLDIIKKENY